MELSSGSLQLLLDSSGWQLTSKGLRLNGWTLEVYWRADGSDVFIREILDLRHAQVHQREVQIAGLGLCLGIEMSSGNWHLHWALKNEAALVQLKVRELLASVEHFCLPFEMEDIQKGQQNMQPKGSENCCWEMRQKRSMMHSSMLVNGWQSFGFSGVLHGSCRQPTTSMPFFSKAFHCGATLPQGCPYTSDRELLVSDMYGYLYLHQDHCDAAKGGVLAGFLSQASGFGGLAVTSEASPRCVLFSEIQGEEAERLSDWCYVSIQSDENGQCSSSSHDAAIQKYIEMSAQHHAVKALKPQPIGWCSWYCHGPNVDELLMMQSLKELKTMGLDSGDLPLQLFQLDDGWQSAWGDWLKPNPKFPNGLKPLTDAVKAAGLIPGIWLAPSSLTMGSRLAQEHPEWILRDERGREVSCGFTAPGLWMRALDTTLPEVLEHVKKTIHTIVHEWGFRYLKCDFLHCAAMPGKRFRSVSRAKACRMLLDAIREAAGEEVFILGCGAPLGPCVGVVDAVRISADTAHHWDPVGPDVWGTRWYFKSDRTNLPAARNMVCSTLARLHMNGRLWVNDPDCLIIRKDVPLAEAQALASVVAFSGGSVIFSDDVTTLEKERLEILKVLLPPLQSDAEVHFSNEEIPSQVTKHLNSAVGSWKLCGLFAWQGGSVRWPSTKELEETQEWHAFEFWSCTYKRVSGPQLLSLRLEPRTCCLYALRPVETETIHAQFLGSNFHVSCGLEVCEWEEANQSLCFTLNVKRRVAAPEVWIFLPNGKEPHLAGHGMEGKVPKEVHPQVWHFSLPPLPITGSTFQIQW